MAIWAMEKAQPPNLENTARRKKTFRRKAFLRIIRTKLMCNRNVDVSVDLTQHRCWERRRRGEALEEAAAHHYRLWGSSPAEAERKKQQLRKNVEIKFSTAARWNFCILCKRDFYWPEDQKKTKTLTERWKDFTTLFTKGKNTISQSHFDSEETEKLKQKAKRSYKKIQETPFTSLSPLTDLKFYIILGYFSLPAMNQQKRKSKTRLLEALLLSLKLVE